VLALTREIDERIYINPGTPDEIVLLVIDTAPGKVRLGIDAPRHIVVHREEVWKAIQLEREAKGA
jgi:carbon storage regulator